MPEAIIRRHLIVHGSVQGVFFRDCTRRCAQSNGVSGWVRNRPDGTVEVILEGCAASVHAVEQFCSEGPEHARVERIEAGDEDPEGLTGFSVH